MTYLLFVLVALRPKSTAMVVAGPAYSFLLAPLKIVALTASLTLMKTFKTYIKGK